MNDFERTILAKSGDPDGELRRYSSEELLNAYSEKLSVQAAIRASELGVEPRELVGVVADIQTAAGREFVGQVLAKANSVEQIHLSGIDPNIVGPHEAEKGNIVTLLVPRTAVGAVADVLEKSQFGRRYGALVIGAGKDLANFRQER